MIKSFLAIFLLAVLSSAGRPLIAAESQENQLDILQKYKTLLPTVEKARKFMASGSLAKSEKELQYCLNMLPEHHEAHFLLGQIRYHHMEYAQGLDHLEKARVGFLHMAQLIQYFETEKIRMRQVEETQEMEMIQGMNDLAERAKCRADSIKNEVAREKANLTGKEKATQAEGQELKLPADYPYWQGNCLFRLQRLPEAEAQYREAIRLDPRHSLAANNLVNLLYGQRRLEEARDCIRQADAQGVEINPKLKQAVLLADSK